MAKGRRTHLNSTGEKTFFLRRCPYRILVGTGRDVAAICRISESSTSEESQVFSSASEVFGSSWNSRSSSSIVLWDITVLFALITAAGNDVPQTYWNARRIARNRNSHRAWSHVTYCIIWSINVCKCKCIESIWERVPSIFLVRFTLEFWQWYNPY